MSGEDPRRNQMIERQIAARGVRSARVLEAMARVPRERFVPEDLEEFAYQDAPLPIGEGQTISQPLIVAQMTELAELSGGERVLEIGTGSGYAAAVLAEVANEVYTIERNAVLAESAARRLRELGYERVQLRCGDGTLGWPEAAPFDAILVAAGGPEVPQALLDQLSVGGRLVIPVGPSHRLQRLLRVRRVATDRFEREDLGPVAFVPLIGATGSTRTTRRSRARRSASGSTGWTCTACSSRSTACSASSTSATPRARGSPGTDTGASRRGRPIPPRTGARRSGLATLAAPIRPSKCSATCSIGVWTTCGATPPASSMRFGTRG